MADLEKVIKALEDADVTDGVIKMSNQFRDVLVAMLKEQGQTINELEDKLRLLENALVQMHGCGRYTPKDVDELEAAAWKALELLKEQEAEARLLTAEEVKNMEAGTAFGIETYYDHDGERIPGCTWALRTERLILSFFGTMFPDTVTKIPYNTLEENQNTGKHEKHQYRFWSKKPTFEQCKEVKWE